MFNRVHSIRFSVFVAIISLSLFLFAESASAQTTRPVAALKRLVLISIDGGRPDLLLRGDCPNIRALMKRGSYSFWARTTAVSITLPSHVSMLTGVSPQGHGIMWNDELPFKEPQYPKVPTLFELAHAAGYSTAMVASKAKFETLNKPGTIDFCTVHEKTLDDKYTGDLAIDTLKQHQPQLLFVHFGGTDVVGHADGWGTDKYMAELAVVDQSIGRIVDTLTETKLLDETAILVSADHGGAGRGHGPDDPRSRHIPWIIAGPGIQANFDLTRIDSLEIHTEDTFATGCFLLGVPVKRQIEGKPIREILQNDELLKK